MIPAPIVTKQEYACVDLYLDDALMLVDIPTGEMKEDLSLPYG